MATLTTPDNAEMQSRVEDYLNDKLQSEEDFDSLNSLMLVVREQQEVLKQQLYEAKKTLDNVQKASGGHAAAIQRKAEEFQKQQEDIDTRLRELTHSDTSDDAAAKFELSMSKVRRLDVAAGYVNLVQEFDRLGSESRNCLKNNPLSALHPYTTMRNLTTSLKTAQTAADQAAPHLLDFATSQTSSLFTELRTSFENDLKSTLTAMGWPSKDLKMGDDLLSKWTDEVGNLVRLQEPDLLDRYPNSSGSTSAIPEEAYILLPLEVMAAPLVLRFRYHFYGDKPTNRIDKPEYFLSHILDVLDTHSGFMEDFLQPVLDQCCIDDASFAPIHSDAISSFISALLPTVSEKALSLLSQVKSQPQLLSHFIHELMSFDTTLRESWRYSPFAEQRWGEWKGLTWSMLTTHGYFNSWLEVEKNFALARYKDIRDSSDSGDLDFDSTGPSSTKPTKGAIRVNDLLETVTDRYRELSSFSQKLRFLIDIQLAIFDDYHGHLHGALQAYLVSSHTAGRLIQGQSASDSPASGLRGLESLSKIFGSAEYLERKMSDWGDDVFFLELWTELQDRARRNSGKDSTIGRDLDTNLVASKTSSTIKDNTDDLTDEGALFDEAASSYRGLRERAEGEIVRALETNVRNTLRSYTKTSNWASLSGAPSDLSILSPSASLDSLLQMLSSQLGFLATVLAIAPLRRIVKQVCLTIQTDLWDNVLLRHSFSDSGVAQFRRDHLAIENVVNTSTKSGRENGRAMRKIDEALKLLSLPLRAAKGAEGEDVEWNFDEDINDSEDINAGQNELEDSDEDKIWTVDEVERRVFKNNESAREILSSMGIELLSESDARNLLGRRVGAGS